MKTMWGLGIFLIKIIGEEDMLLKVLLPVWIMHSITLKVKELTAQIRPNNLPSRKVAESLEWR